MASKEPGYVYILTNPSFREDWVKIGMSSRPVAQRVSELDNTSVPLPFDIYATMKTVKYTEAEKHIHRYIERFTNLRIRDNREFFNIKPEVALDIFREVATLIDDAEIEETYKVSLFGDDSQKSTKHPSTHTPARDEAKIWMIPANPKYYDVDGCIAKYGEVYWRQHFNFQTGDTIYIYVSSPDSKVKYKCLVEAHDLPFIPEIEVDKEFYVNPQDFETTRNYTRFIKLKLLEKSNSENMTMVHLQEHGMNRPPQGSLNLSHPMFAELLKYIENNF